MLSSRHGLRRHPARHRSPTRPHPRALRQPEALSLGRARSRARAAAVDAASRARSAELRVAVISSGGVHLATQEPFHSRNDISDREIPTDTDASERTRRSRTSATTPPTPSATPAACCRYAALRALDGRGVIGDAGLAGVVVHGRLYSAPPGAHPGRAALSRLRPARSAPISPISFPPDRSVISPWD